MDNTVDIRRLDAKDLDMFFALRLKGLQEAPSSFSSTYSEEKTAGSGFFNKVLSRTDADNVIFGAFVQHELIGVIGIFREDKIKLNHKANIWGVYVDASYRRKGVARKLLGVAIAYAKERMQCLSVCLTVEDNNTGARQLYESIGFKPWGTEPYALKLGENLYDEVHMVLKL